MAGIGPLTQDWEPVTLRKKAPTAAAKKDEKAVNAARRSGAEIETVKKCEAIYLSVAFICIFCPSVIDRYRESEFFFSVNMVYSLF